ncbi:MAG: DoxX [Tardiphaga sp.]|nr:DoxX [Tardiphaga sp.]
MPAFIVLGRILFAVLFIVSGASKLLDIPATTAAVSAKVSIPVAISEYTTQLETATGMTTPQMLAIATGAIELVCGIMIALNFGAAFFALLLAFTVVVITLYFHDFWNMAGDAVRPNMIHAMKNLSLVGALFIIAGIGGRRRAVQYQDV